VAPGAGVTPPHTGPGARVAFARPALACAAAIAGLAVSATARGAGVSGLAGLSGELWQWLTTAAHWRGSDGIPVRAWEHVYYTAVSMVLAMAIALPVGVGLGHLGRGGLLAINVANIGRAVPEFGVVILVFLIAGYGDLPIVVTLVALGIPPILTNSFVGMRAVAPEVREAARAMGMTGAQMLWRVELPIAAPVVLAGIRTSAVQVLSTATLAAYVGLGGLGRYLIDGLAQKAMVQVLGGAILVALLALALEAMLAFVQRRVISPGLQ